MMNVQGEINAAYNALRPLGQLTFKSKTVDWLDFADPPPFGCATPQERYLLPADLAR